MSLGIAICFDYSLFMLNRYKEERIVSNNTNQDAVFKALASAGIILFLSFHFEF